MLVGIFGMLVGCWLMVCWVMQLVSQVSEALACKQALKQPCKQALKQPRTQRHCSAYEIACQRHKNTNEADV